MYVCACTRVRVGVCVCARVCVYVCVYEECNYAGVQCMSLAVYKYAGIRRASLVYVDAQMCERAR